MNSIEQYIIYYEEHLAAFFKIENEKPKEDLFGSENHKKQLLSNDISTMESMLGLTKDERDKFRIKIKKKLGI